MPKKILVPVDYSPHSKKVLEYALALAGTLRAEVRILHVWETQPRLRSNVKVTTADGKTSSVAELIKQEAEAAMVAFVKGIELPEGVRVTRKLLSGSSAEAILAEVERSKIDLIVMGTRSRTGIGRFMLGSTAERVLHDSPIPVLVVPKRND
jgi:universal stress protein A